MHNKYFRVELFEVGGNIMRKRVMAIALLSAAQAHHRQPKIHGEPFACHNELQAQSAAKFLHLLKFGKVHLCTCCSRCIYYVRSRA